MDTEKSKKGTGPVYEVLYIRLTKKDKLKDQLTLYADQDGVTLNKLCCSILRNYIYSRTPSFFNRKEE